LKKTLAQIQKKGGIESKVEKCRRLYCNTPLVVGMYEFQVERLTPEFIKDFNDYTSDINFGLGFLSTDLPQMRTIPVAKSITPEHHVSSFDEVAVLLQQADGPFVVVECICRKKKTLAGEPCKQTHRDETCLAIGGMAQMVMDSGIGRAIQRDEALSIIEQNQQDGLILQPSNTKKAEFICSCCGCCCGMLGIHKKLPKPLKFWATNFHAVVDVENCIGCGLCEDTCQVNAVSVSEKNQSAIVDKDRCLGCGTCLSGCPTGAMSLQKNQTETIPPQTREELFDIIMANQKSRFDKFMLAGKLVVDALRTGHTDILKN